MKIKESISMLSNAQVITILWGIGLLIGNWINISMITIYTFSIISFLLIIMFKKIEFVLLFSIILLGGFRINISDKKSSNNIQKILQNNNSIQQEITGTICSEVIKDEQKYKFILDLKQIANEKISGKIKFSTRTPNLTIGDQVSGLSHIFPIQKTSNPNSFDYEEFLIKKGIYGYGFSITNLRKIKNSFVFDKLFTPARKYLRTKIERTFSSNSNFVKAIVIGEREDLEQFREKMSKAGLSHILAVSGLHTGLLSFILLISLNIFIWRKNVVRFIVIIALFYYAGICQWSPSVTRAMIMINIYLLAKISQREIKTLDTLAVSFILITAINPYQLLSIGFQMSFVAVLVLLNTASKFEFLSREVDEKLWLYLSKNVVKSIILVVYFSSILNIFLAPLTLFYFNQVTFNGIIANILGIFLVSLTLPLALLIILLPNTLFLSTIYLESFEFLMNIFYSWVNFTAKLPLNFEFIKFGNIEFVVTILFLLLMSISIKFSFKRRYILPLSIILFSSFLFSIAYHQHDDMLNITCFDCKLGDLHLIQKNNFSMLIDIGPTEKSHGYFKYSALPYFKKNGLKKLDYLVITHAHNDHYGGYKSLLDNVFIKQIILTDEFQTRDIYPEFVQYLNPKTEIITLMDTTSIFEDNLKIKFLYPDKNYQDDGNFNNSSIVFRLDYFDFSALFTGDLEFEGEEYLLEHYSKFLDVDFLKVGHHGSKTSSTSLFLSQITPKYSFVSTSLKNKFGFPHQKTISNLKSIEQELFISGEDGALQIFSNDEKTVFETILTNRRIEDYEI